VRNAYFKDDNDGNPGLPPYTPGYSPNYDRTYLGPNPWNLGPPNGQQRADDILAVIDQYFHDCPLTYSHSWYITDPDPTTVGWLGVADGVLDNETCTDSLVVLNFGRPDYQSGTYGTNYFADNFPFISDLEIIYAAEQYAEGWYSTTSACPRLKLVVGTNNYHQIPSGGGTPGGAGSEWADVVDAVQDYLIAHGSAWQITAWAGSDMEQPSGSEDWDCADRTREFVSAYNDNINATDFLNYGTAWVPRNCPDIEDDEWTAEDVYYVSWGAYWNYPAATDLFWQRYGLLGLDKRLLLDALQGSHDDVPAGRPSPGNSLH
jgi:hypothetical protein